MAFVQDDEEQDPNAPPQTSSPDSVITGAGGGSNSKAPTSPNAPGGMPGNFVGIQQYLDANKPQSEKLANQVGGYVTDLGDTARKTVGEQKNQFDQAVGQNTVGFNQDIYNQAQTNAEKVASDAAKKAEFQKMYNANYQGPTSFTGSDYDTTATKATQAAVDAANQTKNEEGQKQLVGGLQKKTAGYTNQGAQAFDSALLQAAPNARQVLSDASGKQADLQANLNAVKAEEDKAAKTAADTTNATGSKFQGTFGNQALQKQIEDALTKRAGQKSQDSTDEITGLIGKLKNGQSLTDNEITKLGIGGNFSVSPYTSLQNYKDYVPDLNPYFNITNANYSGQQVATPEEYARYQALNDLTGQKADYLSNPSLSGQGSGAAVGGFDLGKFMEDAIRARDLKLAEEQKTKDAAAAAGQGKKSDSMQVRTDDAVNAGLINPMFAPVGFASPEIRKAGSSISSDTKKAGGNVAKAAKKIFSDKNLKTNISKFDPSEFLDSLTRKQHG